jgi:hypothetical protein
MCVVNLQTTEDLNPKVAADGLSSCRVKYLFWYPLILHVVLRTFLETKTSNKNHTLKSESVYPLHKFQANPPIFTQFRSRSFLFCFSLTLSSFLGRLSPDSHCIGSWVGHRDRRTVVVKSKRSWHFLKWNRDSSVIMFVFYVLCLSYVCFHVL